MIRLALILSLVCGSVAAAPTCKPSLEVLRLLQGVYGESVHETLIHNGTQWIMWVNDETGSWTLTGTQGPMTCAFAGAEIGYRGQRIDDFLKGLEV